MSLFVNNKILDLLMLFSEAGGCSKHFFGVRCSFGHPMEGFQSFFPNFVTHQILLCTPKLKRPTNDIMQAARPKSCRIVRIKCQTWKSSLGTTVTNIKKQWLHKSKHKMVLYIFPTNLFCELYGGIWAFWRVMLSVCVVYVFRISAISFCQFLPVLTRPRATCKCRKVRGLATRFNSWGASSRGS